MVEIDEKFRQIIEQTGLCSPYDIYNTDISSEDYAQLQSINLSRYLIVKVKSDKPNIVLVHYIVEKLGLLRDYSCVELLLDSMEKLYPIAVDILRYIQKLDINDVSRKKVIGKKLVDLYFNDCLKYQIPQ